MDATPRIDPLAEPRGFVALPRRESPMLLTFCPTRR